MTVGAIVPHLGRYGGIRIYLEMGEEFLRRGIEYTMFVGNYRGHGPDWFDYSGKIEDWSEIKADFILASYPPDFDILRLVKGEIFIHVIVGGNYLDGYRAVYGVYPFILNNRVFGKYFPIQNHIPIVYLVEGPIDIHKFTLKKRKVLFYDDPRPCKGSLYIKEQLKDLPGVELIGLKGLNDKQMRDIYKQADYFVAWESREGLSGTAAEAIASGIPVVTNGFNCEPFLDRVIKVKDLRKFFEDPMGDFSTTTVVDKLIEIFEGNRSE